MDTEDEKEKNIRDIETNHLIDLYKEVQNFMSFLYDEQKKSFKENE